MPRYAVRPNDLEAAAALTAGEGPALDVVRRLVSAAVGQAESALGPAAGALSAAVEDYGQVETEVTRTLAEAAGILAGGLVAAAGGYARVDAGAAVAFGGSPPGGGP
jgi:hypothetical protein